MDRYLSFSGCATRSEYWAVQLISFALFLLTTFIGAIIATTGLVGIFASAALILFALAIFCWLLIAVTIKRCRDAGINPWFTLSAFIPYIGVIPWIVFGCLQTKKEI